MKSLSDYTQQAQTKAFDDNGAFFSFGQKQFDEKKQEGVKYAHLGSGLICPSENAQTLIDQLDTIHTTAIKQDIAENGVKNIIHRELANHETQITLNFTDTIEALEDYGITAEQIKAEWKEYYDECVANDWF